MEKIGEPVVMAEGWGKRLLRQIFRKKGKEGEKDTDHDFFIFDYKGGKVFSSIILPITTENEVIAVRQFRQGANDWIMETPGGNPGPAKESPEEVARKELLEETGYKAEKIIPLASRPIWFEPASNTTRWHPMLALGCIKITEVQLDETEEMETALIPLPEWLAMINDQRICDSKTIALTMLALLHLGMKIA